jgi:hypothetical protein
MGGATGELSVGWTVGGAEGVGGGWPHAVGCGESTGQGIGAVGGGGAALAGGGAVLAGSGTAVLAAGGAVLAAGGAVLAGSGTAVLAAGGTAADGPADGSALIGGGVVTGHEDAGGWPWVRLLLPPAAASASGAANRTAAAAVAALVEITALRLRCAR